MAHVNPNGSPGRTGLDQLALVYNQAAMENQTTQRGLDIFRGLGRHMTGRLATSKEPINSSDGIEVAFEATLEEFKQRLSPLAQKRLMEYLIDHQPGLTYDYQPGDPYFMATVNSYGTDAVFEHITRGIVPEVGQQLQLEVDGGYDGPS